MRAAGDGVCAKALGASRTSPKVNRAIAAMSSQTARRPKLAANPKPVRLFTNSRTRMSVPSHQFERQQDDPYEEQHRAAQDDPRNTVGEVEGEAHADALLDE